MAQRRSASPEAAAAEPLITTPDEAAVRAVSASTPPLRRRHRSAAGSSGGAAAAAAGRASASSSSPGGKPLHRLESFDNLPDYLRDNEYIVGFYRPEQPSVWGSLRTLFALHNETGNVWTHFGGCLLFAALAVWFCTHPPTPLAVTAEHVEHLWHDLAAGLHTTGAAHSLQALSQRLGERVAALEGALAQSLTDTAHHLADGLSHGVGAGLVHGVEQGLHHLADGLHDVERRLLQHGRSAALHLAGAGGGGAGGAGAGGSGGSPAAAAASLVAGRASVLRALVAQQLRAQLAPVVQWPSPRWPVYVYFAGACVCMLTSGLCHLLGCCQRHIAELVWRFDYAGIAVLIVASFVPAVYYAFLCEPFWRMFYLLTTAAFGAATVALSLPTMFQARHFRGVRAAVFTLLGLWGVVPVTHQLLAHGHVWAIRRAFHLDLLMGAIYIAGALIYALRVPERWFPGKLDIVGHSHQLWHAAVVLAAWVHYRAVMLLLQWRDAAGGCAAPGGVNGPVADVFASLASAGSAPLALHEVYDALGARLESYVVAAVTGAAAGASTAGGVAGAGAAAAAAAAGLAAGGGPL